MKRLMSVVLSMVVVLMMCGGAMAEDFNAQGSTLVPHIKCFRGANGEFTTFYLSNITDKPVQCLVTMYDHNGNDVASYAAVYTVAADGINMQYVGNGDNIFEIPAHSTRYYGFSKGGVPNRVYGYGVIRWKSSDPQMQKALVGAVLYSAGDNTKSFGGNVFLNNGNPF